MRTTLDLDEDLRARLKEWAARRGEKGYSSIVNEALREFLDKKERRKEQIEKVLELRGSMDAEQADQLEERMEKAWKSWDL